MRFVPLTKRRLRLTNKVATQIRHATKSDIPSLTNLLLQVHLVHSSKRPDIFRPGSKKYTESELAEIIDDKTRPILVAEDAGLVVGYAFTVLEEIKDDKSLTDRRALYLDDLCVDEKRRREHIGEALDRAVKELARELGCYEVTLNVWTLNEGALRFYEKQGLKPLKVVMEDII